MVAGKGSSADTWRPSRIEQPAKADTCRQRRRDKEASFMMSRFDRALVNCNCPGNIFLPPSGIVHLCCQACVHPVFDPETIIDHHKLYAPKESFFITRSSGCGTLKARTKAIGVSTFSAN